MAEIDPKSGFCSKTKIFRSLRPSISLPPETNSLSVAEYAFSTLRSSPSSPENTIAVIDVTTGQRLYFSDLIRLTENLTASLQIRFGFSKGDTAFVISPPSPKILILYFSLLSLGVIISPTNPTSTISEISRQIDLTKPVIAFATSDTAKNLPSLRHGTILLDSPDFQSMTIPIGKKPSRVEVNQSDTAAILYSSGTTGRVKGVVLTHRNFIALIAGFHEIKAESVEENPLPHPVALFTVPLFHVFGFFMCLRAVALAETVVLMERFDFVGMLKAIETYRVTFMPVSPPLVVAMAKLEVVKNFDLSSLIVVGCGGAPLGKEVSEKFISRFPHVQITQGYGLTETTGGATRMLGPDETKIYGSVGRLAENMEAKIIDPSTGEALLPGQRGELWLRGPTIMKGDV